MFYISLFDWTISLYLLIYNYAVRFPRSWRFLGFAEDSSTSRPTTMSMSNSSKTLARPFAPPTWLAGTLTCLNTFEIISLSSGFNLSRACSRIMWINDLLENVRMIQIPKSNAQENFRSNKVRYFRNASQDHLVFQRILYFRQKIAQVFI